MGKKNNEEMSAEHFTEVLSKYDYSAVGRMIDQGYLETLDKVSLTEAVRGIIRMKDSRLIDRMVKKGITFTPKMFDIDLSGNRSREIINYAFKYTKSLDLSGEEQQNAFFEIACVTSCIPFLKYMTSNHMAARKYALLAAGSTEMADLLAHLGKKELTSDLILAAFVEAAMMKDYQYRIPYLQKKGLDIKTTNAAGQDAAALFREKIRSIHYLRNKNGELTRTQHKNAANFLYTQIHPAPKKEKPAAVDPAAGKGAANGASNAANSKRKLFTGIAAAVIIISIICGTAAGIHKAKAASASESAASTEEILAENETEAAAEESAE